MCQVPKMLGVLRRAWAPEAFIVSFKLETDEGLLITKVPHPGFHAVSHWSCQTMHHLH